VDGGCNAPIADHANRTASMLGPDEVPFTADGDADLGRELVAAANAFAGL
jgi:hypothetical protein